MDETRKRESSKSTPSPQEVLGFDLRLGNVKGCRNTQARILREFAKGHISEGFFKALTYGVQSQIGWFKLEKELEIEARLDALEERLQEAGQ